MKFIVNRTLIVFIFVTLAASAAFGKTNKATVSFSTDTKVNGTLVKKGTYDVKFDDQTGELTILRYGKEIAKATARAEKRDRKADRTTLQTVADGSDHRLVSIAFGGSDQEVVLP